MVAAAAAVAAAEQKQWSGSGSNGRVVVVAATEKAEDLSLCQVVVTGFPLLDGVKFPDFSLFFLGMSMPV